MAKKLSVHDVLHQIIDRDSSDEEAMQDGSCSEGTLEDVSEEATDLETTDQQQSSDDEGPVDVTVTFWSKDGTLSWSSSPPMRQVLFSFENHEAIFPILIRRPSVPVLYDPGKDINSQVTIITKTFLRYKELNVLIQSIRKFYPNIKIIVADDSLKPEPVSGNNIEHYIMPPAQGWFAGRNLALSQVRTKYFLWVDDDFLFLKETRIESFVEIMEAIPELDVLGGEVSGEQFHFILEYDEGDEEEGGCLKRIKGGFHQPLSGYNECFLVDGVVNYFLARTEAVRSIGFDPFLKRVGHTEFFIDALGKLLVASCKGLSIGHQTHQAQNEYDLYRTQGKLEEKRKLAHHFFKNYLNYIKY